MISGLVTFFVVGLVAVLALGLVLALVGVLFSAALGLAGFLLFKVAPIVLLGWLVVKFLEPREERIAGRERRYLDG